MTSAALTNVYNHYLASYAPRGTSRYDTHKKSELRSIYNSIVKLNKESPLYILDTSQESREFAVGLKENARQLRNTIASLGGISEDEMFNKKAAYSSNEDMVSATYIGDSAESSSAPSFNIEVTALASNQVNLGTFLPSNAKVAQEPGAYSFDIGINDLNYEFQYNIYEGETNLELQERLSRLITNADIGITSDVVTDDRGNSSLRLTSSATGTKNGQELIFQVSDDKTSKRNGTVEYLGLDFVSRPPANAEFLLDGEKHSASSNHFTIDKLYELNLNGISSTEGETAEIGLKTDVDSLTENIENLVGGYNTFISDAAKYLESHPRSSRLISEMERMALYYKQDLETLGLSVEDGGQLSVDGDSFKQTLMSGDGKSMLSVMQNFTNSVLRKTNQISINPMEYVDKTIVAYKNPGRNFAAPYVTSNYSGMLFNSYC